MSSGNWVIDNLNNALKTWNDKLSEIWQLVSQSPMQFKGGGIFAHNCFKLSMAKMLIG